MTEASPAYAPLGINYETRKLLSEPINEDQFAKNIYDHESNFKAKGKGIDTLEGQKTTHPKIIWSFLIAEDEDESRKNEIKEIIKPLAIHRKMRIPDDPMQYYGETHEWRRWLRKNFDDLPYVTRPDHILIVGDPELIPFGFQSLLDIRANVGRVCFDALEDLRTYVEKIIKLEQNPLPLKKEATFFAPNYGREYGKYDPTHYSYNDMVMPLSKHLSHQGVSIVEMSENKPVKATKKNFVDILSNSKSALIYIASHGVGGGKDLAKQKKVIGAICDQNWNTSRDDHDLITAEDIPEDEKKPFLEGSVFFQFSCFGYGTPKYNDIVMFSTDSRPKKQIAEQDLVAAIPKKLLAHPRGPVAFIGHVNVAYLKGFFDTGSATPSDEKHDLGAYRYALDHIFANETLGKSMDDMNMKGATLAANFTHLHSLYQDSAERDDIIKELIENFLLTHDSRNYLLFGDPAVRLQVIQ